METMNPTDKNALGVSAQTAAEVGRRLRDAREASGKTTFAIATKVKIREPYLVAIEQGNWNQLPPGLNGRGLVRIYARELSVAIPELESKYGNAAVSQADPVAPYQVVSRNAFVERELSKASMDLVRSVPRSNGGAPESIPVARAHPGAVSRAGARQASPSDGTFGSGGGRMGEPVHPAAARAAEQPLDVVTPDVASILGIALDDVSDVRASAPHARGALGNPDGIPEVHVPLPGQGFDAEPPLTVPMSKYVPSVSQAPESAFEPEASETRKSSPAQDARLSSDDADEQVIAYSLAGPEMPVDAAETAAKATDEITARAGAQAKSQDADPVETVSATYVAAAPETVPMADIARTTDEAVTRVTAFEADAQLSHVPEATAGDGARVIAMKPPKADVATPVSQAPESMTPPESQPVSHIFKEGVEQASRSDAPAAKRPTRKASGKHVLAYAAAAVALMAGGAVYVSNARTSQGEGEEGHGSIVGSSEGAASNASQGNQVGETNVQAPDSATIQDAAPQGAAALQAIVTPAQGGSEGAADAANSATTATAATAATATGNASAKEAATSAMAPSGEPAPAMDLAQGQSAAPTAVDSVPSTAAAATAPRAVPASEPPAQAAAAGGVSKATLDLSEAVEIQVVTDGKKVFNGTRAAGPFEIEFSKRAEILVQDGSKVKLSYGGWDHGLLGHEGRTRRIFLNAESYAPAAPR